MTIIDKSTSYKGDGTGILLIHGLGGTPVEMRYIAQGLNRAGYTVNCCQLAGHCGSIDDLKNSSIDDWIQSVETAFDKMKDCENIFVGGLSAGSLFSLYLGEKYPDKIKGLILYSPTILLNGWAMPFYMGALHYLRPNMIMFDMLLTEREPHGLKDERIRAMIVDSMKKNSKDVGTFKMPLSVMAKFNSFSSSMRKKLNKIEVPLITFHSRNDDFADISNSYEIINKVSGKADLVVLEDSYHIITLDKQRGYVLNRSKQYVDSNIEKKQQQEKVLQYKPRSLA